MSLIEAAVAKAKKIAETGVHLALKSPDEPVEPRPRRTQDDAAVVAARVAQARVMPVAPVDEQAMERSGVVLMNLSDAAAQRSYRILRTRVQQRMQANDWYSLAITAAGAGEGKTITAINLAISLARDINTWVYLVDLDLQRPKVAGYLGMEFQKGISDYLAGTAEFEDILYSPGVERLCVIPNRQAIEHSSDALGSPRIRELCQSLAEERPRPIVIYDLPPLLLSDDVLKFAPNVEATLFVVSEGLTSRAVLQRSNEMLKELNLLGVVLNRAAERQESAYY